MQSSRSVIDVLADPTQQAFRGRVLVVEDDQYFLSQVVKLFSECSYTVIATSQPDQVQVCEVDAAILEAHLVLGQDGANDLLRKVQRERIPTILLTSRDSSIDRESRNLVPHEAVVARPFHVQDLISALEVQLNANGQHGSIAKDNGVRTIEFGDITIDLSSRTVLISGTSVELSPREFDLLAFLVSRDGALCSRSLLLDRVWGMPSTTPSRTLDVHIRWLRGKIEPDPSHPKRLLTVRSIGYRLVKHGKERHPRT